MRHACSLIVHALLAPHCVHRKCHASNVRRHSLKTWVKVHYRGNVYPASPADSSDSIQNFSGNEAIRALQFH